ncbi:hypothetical protein Rhopal_006771-T1 [Rhodotorula paludigena]|uniref:Uncharacterized protein n=1 Tax=Rhodotorula paludigena TaxID=86838 RepID=A0AAV5GT74_9BASI|nr:hypothetical protein Rhopal_006771-T1 [Rhodotorula paludigena]
MGRTRSTPVSKGPKPNTVAGQRAHYANGLMSVGRRQASGSGAACPGRGYDGTPLGPRANLSASGPPTRAPTRPPPTDSDVPFGQQLGVLNSLVSGLNSLVAVGNADVMNRKEKRKAGRVAVEAVSGVTGLIVTVTHREGTGAGAHDQRTSLSSSSPSASPEHRAAADIDAPGDPFLAPDDGATRGRRYGDGREYHTQDGHYEDYEDSPSRKRKKREHGVWGREDDGEEDEREPAGVRAEAGPAPNWWKDQAVSTERYGAAAKEHEARRRMDRKGKARAKSCRQHSHVQQVEAAAPARSPRAVSTSSTATEPARSTDPPAREQSAADAPPQHASTPGKPPHSVTLTPITHRGESKPSGLTFEFNGERHCVDESGWCCLGCYWFVQQNKDAIEEVWRKIHERDTPQVTAEEKEQQHAPAAERKRAEQEQRAKEEVATGHEPQHSKQARDKPPNPPEQEEHDAEAAAQAALVQEAQRKHALRKAERTAKHAAARAEKERKEEEREMQVDEELLVPDDEDQEAFLERTARRLGEGDYHSIRMTLHAEDRPTPRHAPPRPNGRTFIPPISNDIEDLDKNTRRLVSGPRRKTLHAYEEPGGTQYQLLSILKVFEVDGKRKAKCLWQDKSITDCPLEDMESTLAYQVYKRERNVIHELKPRTAAEDLQRAQNCIEFVEEEKAARKARKAAARKNATSDKAIFTTDASSSAATKPAPAPTRGQSSASTRTTSSTRATTSSASTTTSTTPPASPPARITATIQKCPSTSTSSASSAPPLKRPLVATSLKGPQKAKKAAPTLGDIPEGEENRDRSTTHPR